MAKIEFFVDNKKIPWPSKPFPGYPAPIWEQRSAYVRDFVSKNGLKPAKQELRVGGKSITKIPPGWKFGGPWGPHLHLGEEIYALDKNQWRSFSEGLVREMNLKVKESAIVKFDVVMRAAFEADITRELK